MERVDPDKIKEMEEAARAKGSRATFEEYDNQHPIEEYRIRGVKKVKPDGEEVIYVDPEEEVVE